VSDIESRTALSYAGTGDLVDVDLETPMKVVAKTLKTVQLDDGVWYSGSLLCRIVKHVEESL